MKLDQIDLSKTDDLVGWYLLIGMFEVQSTWSWCECEHKYCYYIVVTALSIIVCVNEICWQSWTHTADDAQDACHDEKRTAKLQHLMQQTTAFLLQQLHPIYKNIEVLMYLPRILKIGSK